MGTGAAVVLTAACGGGAVDRAAVTGARWLVASRVMALGR